MDKILRNKRILSLYNDGKSMKDVAKELNISSKTVKKILVLNNIELRSYYEYKRKVKTNPFSNLEDPETQYWLGWLASDGSIGENTIKLELAEDSLDVLYNFKKFLNDQVTIQGPYHINSKGQNSFSVRFSNYTAIKTLNEIGITNRKSKNIELKIPITWEFLKGLFEGDGTVYKTKNSKCNHDVLRANIITASEKLFIQICNFFTKENIPIDKVHEKRDDKIYYRVWIKDKAVKDFYNKVYSLNIPSLNRKLLKFKNYYA